jgi:2-oxoglutarate dehydrogenase E1 component
MHPTVEELYEKYLEDPAGVPEEWRGYFDKLQAAAGAAAKDVAHAPVIESFASSGQSAGPTRARRSAPASTASRFRNPAGGGVTLPRLPARRPGSAQAQQKPHIPELEPAYYDLTEADMDTVFNTGSLIGPEQARCARSSARCRKPTAGRSALSTCTSAAARESLDPGAPGAGALQAELRS